MIKGEMESKSKMFTFITRTYNPMAGSCPHNCTYCWAQKLAQQRKMVKYQGECFIKDEMLNKRFKNGECVFLCDMLDPLAEKVPREEIQKLFTIAINNTRTNFLVLTKNPGRYLEFAGNIPINVIVGATIESNRDYLAISEAPFQTKRLEDMIQVRKQFPYQKLFVSIEPVLDFDAEQFNTHLELIKPESVAIGYDNYKNNLVEPERSKVLDFIKQLEKFTTVWIKTLKSF